MVFFFFLSFQIKLSAVFALHRMNISSCFHKYWLKYITFMYAVLFVYQISSFAWFSQSNANRNAFEKKKRRMRRLTRTQIVTKLCSSHNKQKTKKSEENFSRFGFHLNVNRQRNGTIAAAAAAAYHFFIVATRLLCITYDCLQLACILMLTAEWLSIHIA